MNIDISQIPSSIQKAWDAVVPPLLDLVIFTLTVGWLIGDAAAKALEMNSPVAEQLLPSQEIQDILDFYNLSALVPLALIVSIFIVADIVGKGVRWIGTYSPPFVSKNTTAQIYDAIGEWELRRLWVCHPDLENANGLNSFYILIDEAIDKAAIDPNGHYRLKGISIWQERVERFHGRFAFIKGLLIVSVAVWYLSPSILTVSVRPNDKMAFITASLFVWAIIILYRYIQDSEMLMKNKIYAYLDVKGSGLPKGGEPNTETWERDQERIDALKNSKLSKQIWSFHLVNPRPKSNAVRQLLGALTKPISDLAVSAKQTNKKNNVQDLPRIKKRKQG